MIPVEPWYWAGEMSGQQVLRHFGLWTCWTYSDQQAHLEHFHSHQWEPFEDESMHQCSVMPENISHNIIYQYSDFKLIN